MSQCSFYLQTGASVTRRRYYATFEAAARGARERIVLDGVSNIAVWSRSTFEPVAVVHRDAAGGLWTEILIEGAAA